MIIVSQGHEKGVGLEVLFKAVTLAPQAWLPRIHLMAFRRTVESQLNKLSSPLICNQDGILFPQGLLRCTWLAATKALPQSTASLEAGLELALSCEAPVLFTLPTTKDDLRNPKRPTQRFLGHTEYLRSKFKSPELGMFFTADDLSVLLLTDHAALKDIPKLLTPRLFADKFSKSLTALRVLEPGLKSAKVAGLNPHAGEGGLLGKEETRLTSALNKLRSAQKKFPIEGFLPGDTLFAQKRSSSELLVYLYHDQGLAPFKALKGTLGANVTLGLEFPRISVDHGTAFSLYGKNIADHRGAYYCLRKAMLYQERVYGKNSCVEGQGS